MSKRLKRHKGTYIVSTSTARNEAKRIYPRYSTQTTRLRQTKNLLSLCLSTAASRTATLTALDAFVTLIKLSALFASSFAPVNGVREAIVYTTAADMPTTAIKAQGQPSARTLRNGVRGRQNAKRKERSSNE